MLSREDYDEAIQATVVGALALAKHGQINEAAAMMAGISKMCWDLTRPDTYADTVDLTPRLTEMEGLTDRIEQLQITVIYDDDSKPLLGYGRGRNADGVVMFGNEPDFTKSEHEFLDSVLKQALLTMGVDADGTAGLISIEKLMRGNTEKIIEDEVAAFSSELDSLFDTWTGGGGGDSPWPPPTSST